MTANACPAPIIRPLPIDAYCETEAARLIGPCIITITSLSGINSRWYRITLLEIETDEVVGEYRYRFDQHGPHEPFFTGTRVNGDPVMFDPVSRNVYATDWNDSYAKRNQAACLWLQAYVLPTFERVA